MFVHQLVTFVQTTNAETVEVALIDQKHSVMCVIVLVPASMEIYVNLVCISYEQKSILHLRSTQNKIFYIG